MIIHWVACIYFIICHKLWGLKHEEIFLKMGYIDDDQHEDHGAIQFEQIKWDYNYWIP